MQNLYYTSTTLGPYLSLNSEYYSVVSQYLLLNHTDTTVPLYISLSCTGRPENTILSWYNGTFWVLRYLTKVCGIFTHILHHCTSAKYCKKSVGETGPYSGPFLELYLEVDASVDASVRICQLSPNVILRRS